MISCRYDSAMHYTLADISGRGLKRLVYSIGIHLTWDEAELAYPDFFAIFFTQLNAYITNNNTTYRNI